jgi:hypothetical protein
MNLRSAYSTSFIRATSQHQAGTSNGSGFFSPCRSSDGPRRGQQLIRPRPHANVFCEVFPPNRSRAINQELRRTGNVRSVRTSAWVQQLVPPNDISLWIRKKWEGVATFLTEILRHVWSIHADRDGQNSLRFEFRKRLFDPSQLEVAVGSPIPAVENQQKRFGRRVPF